MPLSPDGVQAVKTILDGVTSEGPTGSPGLVFIAIDKSGSELVSHAAGNRGINSTEPMDSDTIFWVASMTKMVTATAVMQLVEQGKIPLDDADFIAKVAPEIKAKQVFADGINGAPQQKQVTMRMLLAHTAGFAYAFWDPRVSMQGRPAGINEFNGDWDDILESPLVGTYTIKRNQPGTMWEYGINIDWAGIIVERVTGQKLNDYFQEHIWTPLGVTPEGITMFPTREQRKNLTFLHQRDPTTGELKVRDHFYKRALIQDTKEKQEKFFHSGGAGLFAKPKEYVKLLAAFLNDGTSPSTGKTILKKETVEKMWENQIPDQPNFARGGPPPQDLLLANPTKEMYPQSGDPPQGWGLSMFLTLSPGDTGRGANTGFWAGIANSFWWVDREKGVAGVIAGNVLPFGDPKIGPAWFGVEKAIYDNLQ